MKVKVNSNIDSLALAQGKVYDVLTIERGWFRIMTELDDDYLFPPEMFEVIEELDNK